MQNPLVADHIEFKPFHVYANSAKTTRVFTEWLSGDTAWAVQVGTVFNCPLIDSFLLIGYFTTRSNFTWGHFIVRQNCDL